MYVALELNTIHTNISDDLIRIVANCCGICTNNGII